MRANFIHLERWLREILNHKIPGDLAEFGVWYGTTFMPMAELARMYQRKIHAVDAFEGMGPATERDAGHFQKGSLSVGGSGLFRVLMKPYKDTIALHEGWVPEILAELEECRFAFVHLDLDQYQPTLDALRFIWPRLNPGGILACHDYFINRDILASAAIDEWVAETDGAEIEATNLESHHAFIRRPRA